MRLPGALALLFALLSPNLFAADVLPGFREHPVADVPGFVSSLVVDSQGTVYCTTTDGWIHRIEEGSAQNSFPAASVRVAALPTKSGGNGGLLGMALRDDATAVVHYTTWSGTRVLDDVIAEVDLATGAETVLKAFVGDIDLRARGVSDEHHGGNPTIASDGSIFVGIGDYGAYTPAQKPEWNGGKIWKIDPQGNATQYALGMRNPFDLAWDPLLERVVVAENGPQGGDELHVLQQGDNAGWPATFGTQPPLAGAVPPVYVFPRTVAPTGLVRLTGTSHLLRRGYLMAAFVTKAIYYFPEVSGVGGATQPPIALLENFDRFVIDVTEAPDGTIYFATASFGGASRIHRLEVPPRGDCNGDHLVNALDVLPLLREINDGDDRRMIAAHNGTHPGTWGCDVNADGTIDQQDLDALLNLICWKGRGGRR